MEPVVLKGLTIEELEALMVEWGQSPYRGRQLFRWINQNQVSDFESMTDLSKSFRQELESRASLPKVQASEVHESTDGTVKYLVGLPDGATVEAVFIPSEDRD